MTPAECEREQQRMIREYLATQTQPVPGEEPRTVRETVAAQFAKRRKTPPRRGQTDTRVSTETGPVSTH